MSIQKSFWEGKDYILIDDYRYKSQSFGEWYQTNGGNRLQKIFYVFDLKYIIFLKNN